MSIGRSYKIVIVVLLLCSGNIAMAQMGGAALPQETPQQQAQEYAISGDYNKAIDIYQKLYKQNPSDEKIYNDYLDVLLKAKKYKDALKLTNDQEDIRPHYPLPYIGRGRVYLAEKKKKKANEEFDKAIRYINGDEMLTTQMVNAFKDLDKLDYAIKTYQRAKEIIGNPNSYSNELAKLYAQNGDLDDAVNLLIASGNIQFTGLDNIKATLLTLLGDDHKKMQTTQKVILKKINEEPQSTFYVDLLVWLYTQKDDWEGALIQVEALDRRDKEQGRRILNFARLAAREKHYDIALKAYNEVTDKGKTTTLYPAAESAKLTTKLALLMKDPNFTKEQVSALATQYDTFITEFPQFYNSNLVSDYAMLEAQYNDDPQKGINILKKAIEQPEMQREMVGRLKLQMGDYNILTGKVWDASLTYSQVDKEFKEDILGEDARFRNARLAYYRNDFEWAQGQLEVLKASTSELIANDALALSVLITENIGPDSNYVPLKRYAYADLLLFQNKDKEAETLLDSIAHAYPNHPLNDDILMLKAKIAEKHHNYTEALKDLNEVYTKFGKDVLGDDALFKMADIYENKLKQKEQAKHYYEQLIIDYPGSTFVQTARKKLSELNNTTPVP